MIVGKKVSLRAVESKDLEQLRDWRNIEGFRKNFREHRELSMLNQQVWFEKMTASANDYMFSIVNSDTQELIGAGGLLYINWVIRSADYSFYIGKDGQYIDQEGYAEEATRLLLKYGFEQLNLNKVWMELYEFDQAKIDFFTGKFAFKKDGVLRQNCFKDGKYHDSFLISLLKSEYSAK
jgi:RimJ/RimL family protein N-acetyltransferase